MSEQNKDQLARLIREHLADRRMNTTDFVALFPEQTRRSVYYWIGGTKAPRRTANIAELEEALGWKSGAIREVLDAPITKRFTLAELRDWEKLEDESEKPAARASELSTDDLMVELVRRVGALQSEVEFLRTEHGPPNAEVIALHGSVHERKSAFGLAALSTEAGRNLEHLEDEREGDSGSDQGK